MGCGADMALEYAMNTELMTLDYLEGNMPIEDAYDNGIVDSRGITTEGVVDLIDKKVQIGTLSQINKELTNNLVIMDLLTGEIVGHLDKPKYPICNCCKSFMKPRHGKYGKFYYCPNSCKKQKCVSDAYWQSIK